MKTHDPLLLDDQTHWARTPSLGVRAVMVDTKQPLTLFNITWFYYCSNYNKLLIYRVVLQVRAGTIGI